MSDLLAVGLATFDIWEANFATESAKEVFSAVSSSCKDEMADPSKVKNSESFVKAISISLLGLCRRLRFDVRTEGGLSVGGDGARLSSSAS